LINQAAAEIVAELRQLQWDSLTFFHCRFNLDMPMKQKLKLLVLFAIAAVLSLSLPGNLRAQVLESVTISATLYEQGPTHDNNTATTISAPAKRSISTATLLEDLAADEFAEGNWTSAKFPAGAKLNYNGTGFEVDLGTNQLVDVSDILSLNVTGQNDITSGNYLDANGQGTPPYTQVDYEIVSLAYSSSGGSSGMSFTVTGLATFTGKATTPNARTGNYTQSSSFSLQDGTGEGSLTDSSGNTVNFVVTGLTVTASGSASENNGNGTVNN
jgi:hypothetical protein